MATQSSDNMLLSCYRTYIGNLEEVSEVDVYLGAGLTMGGLLLSIGGWLAFLWNETTTYGTAQFLTVREITVAVVGLGIPLFFLGTVAMLLGSDRMTALGILGLSVCVSSVMLFVVAYPDAWDVPGQFNAPIGVFLYGVGLGALLFAAGAAYSCRVTGYR